jgi:hypothetical protein
MDKLIEYIDEHVAEITVIDITQFQKIIEKIGIMPKLCARDLNCIIKYITHPNSDSCLLLKHTLLIFKLLDKISVNNNLNKMNIQKIFNSINIRRSDKSIFKTCNIKWIDNIKSSGYKFDDIQITTLINCEIIKNYNIFDNLSAEHLYLILKIEYEKGYCRKNEKMIIELIQKFNIDYETILFHYSQNHIIVNIPYTDSIINIFKKSGYKFVKKHMTDYFSFIGATINSDKLNEYKIDHLTTLFNMDLNFMDIINFKNSRRTYNIESTLGLIIELYGTKYDCNITENEALYYFNEYSDNKFKVTNRIFTNVFKFKITENIIKNLIYLSSDLLNIYNIDKYIDIYDKLDTEFLIKYGCINNRYEIVEYILNKKILPNINHLLYCLNKTIIYSNSMLLCNNTNSKLLCPMTNSTIVLLIKYGLPIDKDFYVIFCKYYSYIPDCLSPFINKDKFDEFRANLIMSTPTKTIYNDYKLIDIIKQQIKKELIDITMLDNVFKYGSMIEHEYLFDNFKYVPSIELINNLSNSDLRLKYLKCFIEKKEKLEKLEEEVEEVEEIEEEVEKVKKVKKEKILKKVNKSKIVIF